MSIEAFIEKYLQVDSTSFLLYDLEHPDEGVFDELKSYLADNPEDTSVAMTILRIYRFDIAVIEYDIDTQESLHAFFESHPFPEGISKKYLGLYHLAEGVYCRSIKQFEAAELHFNAAIRSFSEAGAVDEEYRAHANLLRQGSYYNRNEDLAHSAVEAMARLSPEVSNRYYKGFANDSRAEWYQSEGRSKEATDALAVAENQFFPALKAVTSYYRPHPLRAPIKEKFEAEEAAHRSSSPKHK